MLRVGCQVAVSFVGFLSSVFKLFCKITVFSWKSEISLILYNKKGLASDRSKPFLYYCHINLNNCILQ